MPNIHTLDSVANKVFLRFSDVFAELQERFQAKSREVFIAPVPARNLRREVN